MTRSVVKLSGTFNWGSDESTAQQAIAKAHGATRAQVLVRWAVQRGFSALPRSGTGGVPNALPFARIRPMGQVYFRIVGFQGHDLSGGLTAAEMTTLDGFEEQLPAGRLGH